MFIEHVLLWSVFIKLELILELILVSTSTFDWAKKAKELISKIDWIDVRI